MASDPIEQMEPDADGWSEWIHPLPGYLMQCCDCGLIHEMAVQIGTASDDTPSFNPGEGQDDGVVIFQMRRAPETADQFTDGLVSAIRDFRSALPGWWFTLGDCSVSADASCGPDRQGPDAHLLRLPLFDSGFHADLAQPASLAEALREVAAQGVEARNSALARAWLG